MAINVRRANLSVDESLIIDFLLQNHTSDSNQRRFDWLYRKGPGGEARAWIAHDSEARVIVGIAGAFPRWIYASRQRYRAWVLGDFAVDPHYRSLGPAIQLQRACMEGLGPGGIYYDFPSWAMTAVYRRLGVEPRYRMTRFAKILRSDGQIQRRIKQPQLARVITSVLNLALGAGRLRPRRLMSKNLLVSTPRVACGHEFTELAEQVGSSLGVCVERSSEYLNWRYREHPYRSYEMIVARREGSLVGYAVLAREGDHLCIVDLFGQPEAIPELVMSAIPIAAERKLETVTVTALDSHPWVEAFPTLGFRRRDDVPVVASFPGRNADPASEKGAEWFLLNGDRES